MTSTLPLVRGRLRPVPWCWLTVLAAGWFLATRVLAGIPGDPASGVVVVRWAAFLLGLGAAILTAPETDPPRDVLRATPLPLWRTLALRLTGWLLLGAVPVVALALEFGGTGRVDDHEPWLGSAAEPAAGDRGRIPGCQGHLDHGRRGGRIRRRHGLGPGWPSLAGRVPHPAPERPRRPVLAGQPGLDRGGQPRIDHASSGAGASQRPAARQCPAAAAVVRPDPAR